MLTGYSGIRDGTCVSGSGSGRYGKENSELGSSKVSFQSGGAFESPSLAWLGQASLASSLTDSEDSNIHFLEIYI